MVRYHGNWCGPGWTAGQYKDADELTEEDIHVPAIDALDACCKRHDIRIMLAHSQEELVKANEAFFEETQGLGLKSNIAGYLVRYGGPTEPSKSLFNLHHG